MTHPEVMRRVAAFIGCSEGQAVTLLIGLTLALVLIVTSLANLKGTG